ncbi:MAG: DUF748 domain-containing protein [Limisphaerales bacterium]
MIAAALMKTNPWRSLPSPIRKCILWILGLLALYAIIGFLVLPPIIRSVAIRDLSHALDRSVTIKKVTVNPFVPSLAVHGLIVKDKDGRPLLSWDEVYLNFELSSVFRKEWTFRAISVSGLFARAQMNKNYTYNFSDLVEKYSSHATNAPPKQSSGPLLVCVRRLQVQGAKLSLEDDTVRTPFKRVVGPVFLAASNVCTAPDSAGSGWLFGKTDANEYFAWRGNFCLTPLRSAGKAIIFDVTMNKFKPLYQDIVNFDIRSGQAGFCANYRFEWTPSNHLAAITNAAFGVSNFRLAQKGATNDTIDLVHFSQTGVSGNLQTHHGEIGLMKFSEAALFLKRGANKTVNVIQIAQPKVSKPAAPGGVLLFLNTITNAVAALINTTNQWTGVIHEINFTNCQAHLLDLGYGRPATLDLNHINLDVKNISNIPNTNATARLSLDWNRNGKINVDLTARLSPPTVDAQLALARLDLETLAPYIESRFNLLIPSADLGLDGQIDFHEHRHEPPDLTFRGDTWLDHFQVVDSIRDENLLKWDTVRVSGIDANLNPPSASIRGIFIKDVSAGIIVETNGTINWIAALRPPPAGPITQKNPSPPAKASPTTTNAIPPVAIATITITNADISFRDTSVMPHVSLDVQNANGTLSGICSTNLPNADLSFGALVDGASPVNVTGRISATLPTFVSLFMTNMNLLPVSPYSGKYAGYRIAQGALSVDVHCGVTGQKLQSQDVITVNQFEFGGKVDSPAATKLPVRLAVAILKDRQGRIILDVPIDGSLNDPMFRIRKVVERALMNILTKVATSPFSFLGAAFGGGGHELSYDDFAPASTKLTEASKKKLDVLVKALYNRPGLQLQISGSVDPVTDREELRRITFEKELRDRRWNSLGKSQRKLVAPDQLNITPKERSRLIDKLYNQAIADGRITPAIIAANTNLSAIATAIQSSENKLPKQAELLTHSNTSEAGPIAAAPQASPQKPTGTSNPKEALLTAIIPVPESALASLALNRAKAVRDYIIKGGVIGPDRLGLSLNPAGKLRRDGSRVYLTLE